MSTNAIRVGGDTYEISCDQIDVTSLRRPDTSWTFIDSAGHQHRWFANGQAAGSYDPRQRYETPSLKYVKDGVGYWEDGEEYEIGHLECHLCGEHVQPRGTADDTQQFIPGLKHYRINGSSVTETEFMERTAHLR